MAKKYLKLLVSLLSTFTAGAAGCKFNDGSSAPKSYIPFTSLGNVQVIIKSILACCLKKKSLIIFNFGGCCWIWNIVLWLTTAS